MRDPLTIRKITCKSTGLPISRVREIKEKLREVYTRVCETGEDAARGSEATHNGLTARQAFDEGASLFEALGWRRQPEDSGFWYSLHYETRGAFQ